MAEPGSDRPGSRGYHASPVPPSPRPSVASKVSRSSLRREEERAETSAHPRPASAAYSRPHTPQTVAAPPAEPPAVPTSPSPPQPVQPAFSPLFTLLTSTSHSSSRQTVHYPTVHYIFADDDPEVLTDALAQHHRGVYGDEGEVPDPNDPADRAVLLDMEMAGDGSGLAVSWASSLTSDWAVTSARLTRMEGGGAGDAGGLGGDLVLNIEGVSIDPAADPLGHAPNQDAELQSSGGSAARHHPAPAADDYADLLQDFEKRMSTLRKVVEAGMARQRAVGAVAATPDGASQGNITAPLHPEARPGDDGSKR